MMRCSASANVVSLSFAQQSSVTGNVVVAAADTDKYFALGLAVRTKWAPPAMSPVVAVTLFVFVRFAGVDVLPARLSVEPSPR
jgi:hypothetical protein